MVAESRGPPRRNLWRTVALGLLAPFAVAGAVVAYDLVRLETVASRVTHLELADDVNLTLLELRRYEKNILLFQEEADVRAFFEHLAAIRQSVLRIEGDILTELSGHAYRALLEALDRYEGAARVVVAGVERQERLERDIRQLGRRVEAQAGHRKLAFELRRHEKNYLLYREAQAAAALRANAAELVGSDPALEAVVRAYLDGFEVIVRNRNEKERALGDMRQRGREIQKIVKELSGRERVEIDRTLAMTQRLSLASLAFLALSLTAFGYLFTRHVRATLRSVEDALGGLELGRLERIEVDTGRLPAEFASLVGAYNRTIDALGTSREELERTMSLLEDVNRELVDRQEEIVELQRLSGMRLLASEIAHEVNNPLSSLILGLGTIREDVPPSDPRRQTLSLMLKEAHRCQEVIRELAGFAKKETLSYRAIDPAKLVSDAIEVVRRQHREKGVVVVASLRDLPESAVVDPILVHQALVNVLANAFEFTPEGGTVEVRGHAERHCMTLEIRDAGAGIPPEHLARVFEPFFSTRKEGGGTGLGLAITQKIIERHAGNIRAQSTPGAETVFTIQLPIDRERRCAPER